MGIFVKGIKPARERSDSPTVEIARIGLVHKRTPDNVDDHGSHAHIKDFLAPILSFCLQRYWFWVREFGRILMVHGSEAAFGSEWVSKSR